jgi:hypothetical protein
MIANQLTVVSFQLTGNGYPSSVIRYPFFGDCGVVAEGFLYRGPLQFHGCASREAGTAGAMADFRIGRLGLARLAAGQPIEVMVMVGPERTVPNRRCLPRR